MQQEIDYAVLGLNIKTKRQSNKLTQEELAEMVGCNPSHISNIENNYTKASLNTLLAIANSLNTSIDSLLLDQYNNQSLALDNEISNAIAGFDIDMKERVLRIIKAL
ncbi:MAG: helix-turn-helix transcriptional regulator [Lachnospiraceae bacterium]|nr:helix-turn-helix transcriptional regulator [Lachnospiraceae bacterium]